MSPLSPSWAGCPRAFCMTTPSWPWPGSWGTAVASAPGPSRNSSPTTCSTDRFGRPGKGNDKGKVEGMVGYMRRNFLVPIPSFESFEALNACLEQRCLERMDAKLRGHSETIGQRMERDLETLLPLPPVAYDACEKQAGRVSSLSLVRYKTNDYSAPVAYGHRDVLVRGYVDQVVISCGSEVIAKHPRSYERDDFVYDPIHYLPLLERKPGALDQAAPLQSWGVARRVRDAAPASGVPHGTAG